MSKAKINKSVSIRSKKKARITTGKGRRKRILPVKTVAVKATPIRKERITGSLITSMNLDEMLEASKVVEMGLRGERIPTVKSSKVQKYVGTVLRLNKRASTKPVAKKMQRNLTVQIVEKNKKTTNEAEAKRLYQAFMDEE